MSLPRAWWILLKRLLLIEEVVFLVSLDIYMSVSFCIVEPAIGLAFFRTRFETFSFFFFFLVLLPSCYSDS